MNTPITNLPAGLRSDVSAVLLAGGNSLRMGRDKALLNIHGRPVVQVLAARLRTVTDEVLLSANDPSAYAFLELPTIRDLFDGRGPLAGLHAGMRHTLRPFTLVLACDLPGVPVLLLQRLIDRSTEYDAVVPCTSDGLLHPVCAIYNRTCLPIVEQNLMSGANQILAILGDPKLRVLRLNSAEGGFRDRDLININSPSDLQNYLHICKS